MAFCTKCGVQVDDGVKFCTGCGTQIEINQTVNSSDSFDSLVNDLNNTADTTSEYDFNDIENNKVMAILSYLSILVLVPILAAPNSKFARYHANQGLVVLLSAFALGVVSAIISALPFIGFIGGIFGTVASMSILLLEILGIVNAATGKAKELPIIGKYRVLK